MGTAGATNWQAWDAHVDVGAVEVERCTWYAAAWKTTVGAAPVRFEHDGRTPSAVPRGRDERDPAVGDLHQPEAVAGGHELEGGGADRRPRR